MNPYLILGPVLFVLILYRILEAKKETDAADEAEYEKQYAEIQAMLNLYPVIEANYNLICTEFEILCSLRHSNPEKTEVLWRDFFNTFSDL
jgi:hypothetical protein